MNECLMCGSEKQVNDDGSEVCINPYCSFGVYNNKKGDKE